jgi:hypothetical protein
MVVSPTHSFAFQSFWSVVPRDVALLGAALPFFNAATKAASIVCVEPVRPLSEKRTAMKLSSAIGIANPRCIESVMVDSSDFQSTIWLANFWPVICPLHVSMSAAGASTT